MPVLLIGTESPASAQPGSVFVEASLTEDAFSPNGDGVKDLTVITFDVGVDSAGVRVLLAQGGAVVDTIQGFQTRPRGVHALPFDGRPGGTPIPDGLYEVWIDGVGTQGEGTEVVRLALEIDIVPPRLTWELSAPPNRVYQNGSLLAFRACFGTDVDSVLVDLSALDSNYDSTQVSFTSFTPDDSTVCREFNYTVSSTNTLADAAGLPATVLVEDRAGNTSEDTIEVCLSNFPPTITEVTLEGGDPVFGNGQGVAIIVQFDSPNQITPGADFDSVDSGFDPAHVLSEDLGGNRFRISYQITTDNIRDDGTYSVRVFGSDQGCGYVEDESLAITLEKSKTSLVLDPLSDAGFSPPGLPLDPQGNGRRQVGVDFTVIADTTVSVILFAESVVYRDTTGADQTPVLVLIFSGVLAPGPQKIIWDGSGSGKTPELLAEQNLVLTLRVLSPKPIPLGTVNQFVFPVSVDRTLPDLEGFPLPGTLATRNGQIVSFPLTYDGSGYEVTADFGNVDSNFIPGAEVVEKNGPTYTVSYRVSSTNAELDASGIVVPVTATDPSGNTATTDLVTLCLDNQPPQFISAQLIDSEGPFRNGDRILLQAVWQTEPHQSTLVVTADFSAVDDQFQTDDVVVIDRGNNTFDIGYTIANANGIEEGTDLPIRVTGSDDPGQGCGATTVDALLVDVDNRAGSQPVFDALPEVSTRSPYTLSGIAEGSVQVQINREGTAIDTFAVDPLDGRFSGTVTLIPGVNSFTARGLDGAGNLSPASRPLEVYLVQETTFQFPPHFTPGDAFFVAVPEPASGVRIRIFNLEGNEIQRLEEGPGEVYQVVWDGMDTTGSLASSGPYLVVAEIEGGGGLRDQIRKAFVFTRQGSQ